MAKSKGNYFLNLLISLFVKVLQLVAISYLCLLVFVFYQERKTVLSYLQVLDPGLGVPLPERSYAEDCRIVTPENKTSNYFNIMAALDFYIIAHLLGWFGKMLIVREMKYVMFLSIFFEFLEITFRHWLPNFWECWWDHIILDIILCNGVGIVAGFIFIHLTGMKKFKWTFGNNKSYIFESYKKFFMTCWFTIFLNAVDLSNFFNKFVLWVPADHVLLQYRVYLWGFLALVATKEYYEYMRGEVMKLGFNVYLVHIILVVEYIILFKFREDNFKEPFPDYVKAMWLHLAIIFVWAIFQIDSQRKKKSKRVLKSKKMND